MTGGGARRFRSRLGIAEGALLFGVFGVLSGGGLILGWVVARGDSQLRTEQNLGTSALWTGLVLLVGTGLFAWVSARRGVVVTGDQVVERRWLGSRRWDRPEVVGLDLVSAGYGAIGLPAAQRRLLLRDGEPAPLTSLDELVFNRRADDRARSRAQRLADALGVPLADRLDEPEEV